MQNLSRRPVRLHLCCQKWWGQDSSHSEGRHSRSETQNIFFPLSLCLSHTKIFSISNRKCFTTFKLFAEILVATASFSRICFENPRIFVKKKEKNIKIIQYSTVTMFNTFISNFLRSFYLEKLNLLLNDKIDTKQFSSTQIWALRLQNWILIPFSEMKINLHTILAWGKFTKLKLWTNHFKGNLQLTFASCIWCLFSK